MTYRIGRDEAIPDAVRRIAREEIDGALHVLATAPPDPAVHAIRKHFKRLRALLRLIRGAMGVGEAKARRDAFRDAARTLSDARDSRILIDGAQALVAASDAEHEGALQRLVASLERRHEAVTATLLAADGPLAALVGPLDAMRRDVERWNLRRAGFEALAPGLRRTYTRGARALDAARATPTSEHLHDWRKRVKDLWYHVTLLQDAWDDGLAPTVRALETLSDRLGLDHDHAVLDATLAQEPALARDPIDRAHITAAIDAARSRLQADVWPLGRRVWSEEPVAFVRRIGAYWGA